jgi:N-acetylglucosamine kinase-like BadF-type ATPase
MRYFLGVDVGGTKTHLLIADEQGRAVGFGQSGPGNPQGVGYEGMLASLQHGLQLVLQSSGLALTDLAGAGFGIAGYDWPSVRPPMLEVLHKLGVTCPLDIVNDAIPGLVAGARDGWGVVVISGTGCNCRGWDRQHKREGRVTGYGFYLGEYAGASELVARAMQLVAYAWTRRGPQTSLTQAFIQHTGAHDLTDLLEGYTENHYPVGAEAAPLLFQIAAEGDMVAGELIHWAGCELGEMAVAVIRQLDFQALEFDVVLSGSMFEGGQLLIEPLCTTVLKEAPGARFVRLEVPPVIGSVMIGMEQGGLKSDYVIRDHLAKTLSALRQVAGNIINKEGDRE